MIKPDMIPNEVVKAAAFRQGATWDVIIAAALNAWPGVGIEVARDESEDIILPLPQENVQNAVR